MNTTRLAGDCLPNAATGNLAGRAFGPDRSFIPLVGYWSGVVADTQGGDGPTATYKGIDRMALPRVTVEPSLNIFDADSRSSDRPPVLIPLGDSCGGAESRSAIVQTSEWGQDAPAMEVFGLSTEPGWPNSRSSDRPAALIRDCDLI